MTTDNLYLCPQVGCTYALENGVLLYHPMNADGTYEELVSHYAEVEWDELDASTEFWANCALVALLAEV